MVTANGTYRKSAHGFDPSRLANAHAKGRLVLRDYRAVRAKMVAAYAGPLWAVNTSTENSTPYNLIDAYVSIISRSLVPKNPRVLLSTFDRSSAAVIADTQLWANDELVRQNFAASEMRVVIDALFGIGIGKVGLASPADSAIAGWQTKAGMPFFSRVSLDDATWDIHARSFEEVGYFGHRYRCPYEVVVNDSRNFSASRKLLSPSDDAFYNAEGDERLSVLSKGTYSTREEYEDFVDLWEVWVPRENAVFTFASDGQGQIGLPEKPLRVQKYVGPASGPYCVLGYGWVPDNAMPKGPIQNLYALHVAMNQIVRKLLRQAERQKEVVPVRGGKTEDGERLQQANDGELFQCDNAESVAPVNFGGPNPANFQLAEAVKQWFSWLGGNLDMQGGLSPQSKTATQDQMLQANSSRGVQDMQETTTTHASAAIEKLCWYWHHHPTLAMKSQYTPNGLPEFAQNRMVTPAQRRRVAWSDLHVKIDPYSMQHQTPASRLQALNAVVQGILTPLMPVLAQQGVQFEAQKYLKLVAQYGDLPELTDIVTIVEPPPADGSAPGGGDAPGMPSATTRNYVRKSVGADNETNKAAIRSNDMAAAMGSGEIRNVGGGGG